MDIMSEQTAGDWRVAARTDEIPEGECLPVEIGETPLAIVNLAGSFYAIHNVCSHQFAFLTDGYMEGDAIECPLHQAKFDVRTGKALTPPATEGVRAYPTRVDGEIILVDMAGTVG